MSALLCDCLRRSISRTVSMILLYLVESVERKRGNALIIRRCCLFKMEVAVACMLARASNASWEDSDRPGTYHGIYLGKHPYPLATSRRPFPHMFGRVSLNFARLSARSMTPSTVMTVSVITITAKIAHIQCTAGKGIIRVIRSTTGWVTSVMITPTKPDTPVPVGRFAPEC